MICEVHQQRDELLRHVDSGRLSPQSTRELRILHADSCREPERVLLRQVRAIQQPTRDKDELKKVTLREMELRQVEEILGRRIFSCDRLRLGYDLGQAAART